MACSSCSKSNAGGDTSTLKLCSGCEKTGTTTYYCNETCQRSHWSIHRYFCSDAAGRENASFAPKAKKIFSAAYSSKHANGTAATGSDGNNDEIGDNNKNVPVFNFNSPKNNIPTLPKEQQKQDAKEQKQESLLLHSLLFATEQESKHKNSFIGPRIETLDAVPPDALQMALCMDEVFMDYRVNLKTVDDQNIANFPNLRWDFIQATVDKQKLEKKELEGLFSDLAQFIPEFLSENHASVFHAKNEEKISLDGVKHKIKQEIAPLIQELRSLKDKCMSAQTDSVKESFFESSHLYNPDVTLQEMETTKKNMEREQQEKNQFQLRFQQLIMRIAGYGRDDGNADGSVNTGVDRIYNQDSLRILGTYTTLSDYNEAIYLRGLKESFGDEMAGRIAILLQSSVDLTKVEEQLPSITVLNENQKNNLLLYIKNVKDTHSRLSSANVTLNFLDTLEKELTDLTTNGDATKETKEVLKKIKTLGDDEKMQSVLEILTASLEYHDFLLQRIQVMKGIIALDGVSQRNDALDTAIREMVPKNGSGGSGSGGGAVAEIATAMIGPEFGDSTVDVTVQQKFAAALAEIDTLLAPERESTSWFVDWILRGSRERGLNPNDPVLRELIRQVDETVQTISLIRSIQMPGDVASRITMEQRIAGTLLLLSSTPPSSSVMGGKSGLHEKFTFTLLQSQDFMRGLLKKSNFCLTALCLALGNYYYPELVKVATDTKWITYGVAPLGSLLLDHAFSTEQVKKQRYNVEELRKIKDQLETRRISGVDAYLANSNRSADNLDDEILANIAAVQELDQRATERVRKHPKYSSYFVNETAMPDHFYPSVKSFYQYFPSLFVFYQISTFARALLAERKNPTIHAMERFLNFVQRSTEVVATDVKKESKKMLDDVNADRMLQEAEKLLRLSQGTKNREVLLSLLDDISRAYSLVAQFVELVEQEFQDGRLSGDDTNPLALEQLIRTAKSAVSDFFISVQAVFTPPPSSATGTGIGTDAMNVGVALENVELHLLLKPLENLRRTYVALLNHRREFSNILVNFNRSMELLATSLQDQMESSGKSLEQRLEQTARQTAKEALSRLEEDMVAVGRYKKDTYDAGLVAMQRSMSGSLEGNLVWIFEKIILLKREDAARSGKNLDEIQDYLESQTQLLSADVEFLLRDKFQYFDKETRVRAIVEQEQYTQRVQTTCVMEVAYLRILKYFYPRIQALRQSTSSQLVEQLENMSDSFVDNELEYVRFFSEQELAFCSNLSVSSQLNPFVAGLQKGFNLTTLHGMALLRSDTDAQKEAFRLLMKREQIEKASSGAKIPPNSTALLRELNIIRQQNDVLLWAVSTATKILFVPYQHSPLGGFSRVLRALQLQSRAQNHFYGQLLKTNVNAIQTAELSAEFRDANTGHKDAITGKMRESTLRLAHASTALSVKQRYVRAVERQMGNTAMDVAKNSVQYASSLFGSFILEQMILNSTSNGVYFQCIQSGIHFMFF
jgi:hypothetical protein